MQALGETLGNVEGYRHFIPKNNPGFSSDRYPELQQTISEWRNFRNIRTHHHSCNVEKMCALLKLFAEQKDTIEQQLNAFYQCFKTPPMPAPSATPMIIAAAQQKLQPHCIVS
jgi:hypothetical protein